MDIVPRAGVAGMYLPKQQLFREIGNIGKASSSIGCLSSQGCSKRQDFPTSTLVRSLGNATQFQQVAAASVVGIGENWTQQAKVPLLQVAPPACSLEEPSKYLTHEAFTCLRQLEMKDASPQFFPSPKCNSSHLLMPVIQHQEPV